MSLCGAETKKRVPSRNRDWMCNCASQCFKYVLAGLRHGICSRGTRPASYWFGHLTSHLKRTSYLCVSIYILFRMMEGEAKQIWSNTDAVAWKPVSSSGGNNSLTWFKSTYDLPASPQVQARVAYGLRMGVWECVCVRWCVGGECNVASD